ncbi:protein PRRC1-like isoform X2 [Bacillus rossius redtenbacheri]|uniref:protein PRRC1-like isoform X2 n=1 Tax=Bacillus rossius redtenbacheri TaxID=93214 RepID=UPI002FDDB1AE
MMQEDSNGESTFEFVEKKFEGMSTSGDDVTKSGLASNASVGTTSLMAAAASITTSAGNLLSNVAPPSALPSFLSGEREAATKDSAPPVPKDPAAETHVFHQTTFSPVIPASKSSGAASPASPQGPPAGPPSPPAGEQSGGLIGWVKGAVGTGGGLLSRVAEKAKSSVDSMITTLDPQMKEFIYSGGDISVVVASDKEIKISPVREAFQAVFGKATVSGVAAQSSSVAAQPVGFEAGLKAAEERVAIARAGGKLHPRQPVVAIENFIVEVAKDKWFDAGALLLCDPGRDVSLHVFTQLTPVPSSIVELAQEDTPGDYPLRSSGLAVPVGSLMAGNLLVHHSEWHHALTGVSRREMLLVAAKALAGLYKTSIGSIV